MKSVLVRSLLLAAALAGASVVPAQARTNVSIGLGLGGPVYAQPYYAEPYYPPSYYAQPVVVPYYQPYYPVYYRDGYYRHREYDWGYWHGGHGPYRGPRQAPHYYRR